VSPITVVVQLPDIGQRKITKIVPYGKKDGGFAVLSPYHSSRQGFLCSLKTRGFVEETTIPWVDTHPFTFDGQVKLSFHGDGFVQFSSVEGATIRSGRDPVTKQPKGVGVKSRPLSNPVTSGPTFGVQVWGLHEFDKHEGGSQRGVVMFDEAYLSNPSCGPSQWRGLALEGFVLRHSEQNAIDWSLSEPQVTHFFPQFERHGGTFTLRAVNIHQPGMFLGLLLRRVNSQFEAASGYSMASPQEKIVESGRSVMRSLLAVYPRTDSLPSAPSIAYKAG
jgi:hypothetical protein